MSDHDSYSDLSQLRFGRRFLVFRWCGLLLRAIEVAFEGVDVCKPKPAKLSQPGIDFLESLGFQAVEATLRVHGGFHEACVAQHAQVLGYRWLRHSQLTLDLSDRLLGGGQEAQDGAAIGLSNDIES